MEVDESRNNDEHVEYLMRVELNKVVSSVSFTKFKCASSKRPYPDVALPGEAALREAECVDGRSHEVERAHDRQPVEGLVLDHDLEAVVDRHVHYWEDA